VGTAIRHDIDYYYYHHHRNFRDFSLFNADLKRPNCPFCRSASAANAIDIDIDIFNGRSVSVNMTG
jgi:hypothetical protein